ncbi:MAG: hypothetical protein Kow0020_01410 [Wenzhouxiangellaceae bacterium]
MKALAQQLVADNRLAESVERMLRPIIRLIVGRVSCAFVIGLIKRIYLEEAVASLERQGERVTKSRLGLLTGLDTRTISALENGERNARSDVEMSITPEALVVELWANNEMFHEDGQPKVLPIFGRTITFQRLVAMAVGRNVTPQTVLERLIEAGNVELVDEDHVRLVKPDYYSMPDDQTVAVETGSLAINRLTRTVHHNIEQNDDQSNKLVQQEIWTIRVDPNDLDQAKKELRNLVEKQIDQIAEILERFEQPVRHKDHKTLGVGWYMFE